MESRKHFEAEISERRDLAPDLWIIRLRLAEPLPFKPGQYVTLGVPDGAKLIERPYSIVSAPHETELEIFFELVPHGQLTPRLYALQPGERLLVRRNAKGAFTFDGDNGPRDHFMLGTVTGVAPFVSIVRQFLAVGPPPRGHRVLVLEGASRSWELGYDVELARLARELDWLEFVPTVSRPWEDAAWSGERGRVDDLIRKYLDRFGCDPATTTSYLCGHPDMITNARGILTRAGFATIREEKFWAAPKAASAAA